MKALFAVAVTVSLVVVAGPLPAQEIADGYALAVDKTGAIRVPDVDYRAKWPSLGTWVVAGGDVVDDESGAAGMHVVYTQPGVIEQYRKTGQFPDGAVLVKELLTAKTSNMTTGIVSHATKIEGWFVMIKDTKSRYPDNKLWGDGWGWAFFGADDPAVTTTKDYKAECLECHVPAKDTDWVYVYGYPALHDAASKLFVTSLSHHRTFRPSGFFNKASTRSLPRNSDRR